MRLNLPVTAGALVASLLASCSPARLLGRIEAPAPGGEVRDLAYAPGPRHAMDLYLPMRGDSPPPVVVFFYGGNWQYGDRGSYAFVGRSLAACGVMTVIPDYRVWPEVGYRGFLQDGASAVNAAREEARRRGGDVSRLFLMGHSAGAYIAAMLALDPEWLSHDTRTGLAGLIGLAGPYDFLPLHDPVLEKIFTPVGPATQPITFAANATAPMLLLSGSDDRTVEPANSTRLAARVRETGGRAETIVYPGISHVTLAGALAQPLRFLAPVRADVCRFVALSPRGSTQHSITGLAPQGLTPPGLAPPAVAQLGLASSAASTAPSGATSR